jgi:hypothetical protein
MHLCDKLIYKFIVKIVRNLFTQNMKNNKSICKYGEFYLLEGLNRTFD